MEIRRREFIGGAFAATVGATTKTLHAQQAARAPSADQPHVRTWQPQVERLFKSPDIHPNALEAAPDGLWIGDQVSEKVLKVDWKTGEVLFELQTESHNMSGLAVGAGYFWIGSNGGVSGRRPPRPTDRPFGEISQIDMETGKVVKTVRAPGHGGVHGTTYVPQTQTLWVTALNIQAVVEMDVKDNLRILRMFPSRGDRAHGLDWDDGAMWVLFAGDREIRKCDPNGGAVLEIVKLSRTIDPDPHGKCIHNGYMYYCDSGLTAPGLGSEPGMICRFKLG